MISPIGPCARHCAPSACIIPPSDFLIRLPGVVPCQGTDSRGALAARVRIGRCRALSALPRIPVSRADNPPPRAARPRRRCFLIWKHDQMRPRQFARPLVRYPLGLKIPNKYIKMPNKASNASMERLSVVTRLDPLNTYVFCEDVD